MTTRLDYNRPEEPFDSAQDRPVTRFSSPAFRAVITALLLIAGIETWLTLGRGQWVRDYQLRVTGIAILVMFVPPIRRRVVRLLDAVRHPSARAAGLISLAVAGVASAYLYLTAVRQGFGFYPKIHDEFMYLTQASLLAHGRLWMPPLPLPDFFDSFYILVDPVYAPLSWPGTSLLLVPGHWLHLPYWLTPLLAAGAVVALAYRIVTELFDGVAGLLAALLLLGVSAFRWQSLTAMSHIPILLLGLGLTWAWIKWRDGARPRWAWVIGALAGWAAITRPIDAICVALPIGIAIVVAAVFRSWSISNDIAHQDLQIDKHDVRKPRTPTVLAPWVDAAKDLPGISDVGARKKPMVQAPWAFRGRVGFPASAVAPLTIALIAGAAPFIALQLIFNLGVTGGLLRSPFTYYNQRDQPMLAFGFPEFDPSRRPVSQLLQKQLFYEQWVVPAAREHTLANAPRQFVKRAQLAFETATAHPLLMVFLPLGLTAMFRRRRWVVLAVLPIFLFLYTAYTLFLPHYALLIVPAVALMVVGAVEALRRHFPDHPGVSSTAAVAIAVLTIASLPEFDRWVRDDYIPTPTMKRVAQLPAEVSPPAIVLFRYEPGADLHQEPVFNAGVAWPDDAAIIHAHDLGPERDRVLYKYYAQREPAPRVYLFDLGDGSLVYLGRAAELAERQPREEKQDRK